MGHVWHSEHFRSHCRRRASALLTVDPALRTQPPLVNIHCPTGLTSSPRCRPGLSPLQAAAPGGPCRRPDGPRALCLRSLHQVVSRGARAAAWLPAGQGGRAGGRGGPALWPPCLVCRGRRWRFLPGRQMRTAGPLLLGRFPLVEAAGPARAEVGSWRRPSGQQASRFYRPRTFVWPEMVAGHPHLLCPMRTSRPSCEGGGAGDGAHAPGVGDGKPPRGSPRPPRETWGSSPVLPDFKFHSSALILGCLFERGDRCGPWGGVWEQGGSEWPGSLSGVRSQQLCATPGLAQRRRPASGGRAGRALPGIPQVKAQHPLSRRGRRRPRPALSAAESPCSV